MDTRTVVLVVALAGLSAGCSSKPAAEVSKSDLAAVRQTHAAIKVGEPKQKVLDSFKAGNKVKLGSSVLDGAAIEEWKVEAFRDEDKRKDLFVTFLYFCDDRFVDSSDTRIDFRNNIAIVDRWKASTSR
jgi:hypothetical protein